MNDVRRMSWPMGPSAQEQWVALFSTRRWGLAIELRGRDSMVFELDLDLLSENAMNRDLREQETRGHPESETEADGRLRAVNRAHMESI